MKSLLTLVVLAMLAVTVNAQTNVNVAGTDTCYGVVSYTPTNWCDRISATDHEQAIKDLAAGGVICKVLGHKWRGGRPGEGGFHLFADYHPGTTYRTCEICGKCESKTEGSWK